MSDVYCCYWLCDLCGAKWPCEAVDETTPEGWTVFRNGLFATVTCAECNKAQAQEEQDGIRIEIH